MNKAINDPLEPVVKQIHNIDITLIFLNKPLVKEITNGIKTVQKTAKLLGFPNRPVGGYMPLKNKSPIFKFSVSLPNKGACIENGDNGHLNIPKDSKIAKKTFAMSIHFAIFINLLKFISFEINEET